MWLQWEEKNSKRNTAGMILLVKCAGKGRRSAPPTIPTIFLNSGAWLIFPFPTAVSLSLSLPKKQNFPYHILLLIKYNLLVFFNFFLPFGMTLNDYFILYFQIWTDWIVWKMGLKFILSLSLKPFCNCLECISIEGIA